MPGVLIDRGVEKVDDAGWERFFVVADGWAIATAVRIAERRRAGVAGLGLGHAALSSRRSGDRAPMNADVYDAFTELVERDAPSFIRYGIVQATRGSVDERRAAEMIDRIPPELIAEGWAAFTAEHDFGDSLRSLECPLLLAKHEGCLMSTDEGFEGAVHALPSADTVICPEAPSASARFAEALRAFCLRFPRPEPVDCPDPQAAAARSNDPGPRKRRWW